MVEDTVVRGRTPTAQPDRWAWLSNRFGPGIQCVEIDEFTVKFGLLIRPDLRHLRQPVPLQCDPGSGIGAVIAHFLTEPADTDAELESPSRRHIETRHFLGEDDRVALNYQSDRGADLQSPCHRGGERQRDERVEITVVAPGNIASAGIGRSEGCRDMGVFGYEQRLEVTFFHRAGEFARADAFVGDAGEDSDPLRVR